MLFKNQAKNKMEEWNSDEWQGKRKDQVEFAYLGAIIAIIGIVFITLIYAAIN